LRQERLSDGGGSVGTAVLGAGPAGLTSAYVLALRGRAGAVFEADDVVGGLARTVRFGDYRFDIGGHRFFTKLEPIERLWEDVLGPEFLTRARLSRIYYKGQFFAYPLTARDVFGRLGVVESTLCALSYARARLRRRDDAETFEEWVTTRFGRRLYDAFFRSYTEKVWGVPGSEIRAEWAAQRIRNFSLVKAALSILQVRRQHVTTLIEEFRYPRLGPGQMWETLARRLEDAGIPVHLNQRCVSILHENGQVGSILLRSPAGTVEQPVDAVLSSIPLTDLVRCLDPPPPAEVLDAVGRLRYRSLCVVALITSEEKPFPDNWIYLHDPGTRAGRVQNFGAWSESMVRPGTSCLGVEYFCFEGDEIWNMPDEQAVRLATDELARIGLLDPSTVVDGVKMRAPKAYPMYDSSYREAVDTVQAYLEGFSNLKTFGRNGLHRYNNQDHSMWTAILATLNLVDGTAYDVWSVNTEAEYHEEGAAVSSLLEVDLLGGEPPRAPSSSGRAFIAGERSRAQPGRSEPEGLRAPAISQRSRAPR
jgi:protoporphyrinogen oxidase